MSPLAGVVVALLAVAYVASGMLTVLLYNTVTDGVDGWGETIKTFAAWPMTAFTVLTWLYALWKTKRELDKLGGGR